MESLYVESFNGDPAKITEVHWNTGKSDWEKRRKAGKKKRQNKKKKKKKRSCRQVEKKVQKEYRSLPSIAAGSHPCQQGWMCKNYNEQHGKTNDREWKYKAMN